MSFLQVQHLGNDAEVRVVLADFEAATEPLPAEPDEQGRTLYRTAVDEEHAAAYAAGYEYADTAYLHLDSTPFRHSHELHIFRKVADG